MSVSKSVAMVVKIVGGMNKAEKKECSDLLAPILKMKKGKGSSQPYWIKKVDDVDPSQTGPYAINGQWLRDTGKMESGDICVIGIKYPQEDRRYAICTHQTGSSVSYEAGSMTLDFEDVAELNSYSAFADCLTKLQRLVPASKAA